MSWFLSKSCAALALALTVSALAQAGDWALKEYACRRKVSVAAAPGGAKVCHVGFATHGLLRPDGGDIRVLDAAGNVLNYELLQMGPGDQAEIFFDAPGTKVGAQYTVYFGWPKAPAPKAWQAEAGVVLQVRKRGEGHAESFASYKKMFENSTEILGRTLRPKIFDGFDPLGPTENIVTFYRAYFSAEKSGTYKFATNSDKASFLLVDGKMVAEYPGRHGAEARFGQRSGTIELAAGHHKMEYYHVNFDGEMMAMAAWARPGEPHVTLMPDVAFVPVARAKAGPIEHADGKAALDFSFAPRDHLVANNRYLVRYTFECTSPAAAKGQLKWDFGDGCVMETNAGDANLVGHGYLALGTYAVTLSAPASGAAPVKQTVVVAPVWAQREEWDDNRWQEYRHGILTRIEAGSVRAHETATLLNYAITLDDRRLLELGAALAWKQAKEFAPLDHDKVFYGLGHHLQRELKDYANADRAFVEVINNAHDRSLQEQAKLHRAGLLIHMLGRNQEGFDLLKSVDEKLLVQPNEPILRQIYMADACAGLGQRDEALRRYDALRPVVNMADRQYATGRSSRLLAISEYIKRGDCEAALRELQNIEWETPKERVSDETAMLKVEAYLVQKDFDLAAILLRRLINVNPASARMPEMLFGLVRAYQGLTKTQLVEEVYAKLRKEHPYAAETALAAVLLRK